MPNYAVIKTTQPNSSLKSPSHPVPEEHVHDDAPMHWREMYS